MSRVLQKIPFCSQRFSFATGYSTQHARNMEWCNVPSPLPAALDCRGIRRLLCREGRRRAKAFDRRGVLRLDDDAEFQSGHFPCSFIHFDMQSLWAVPPPVADAEHRCMHFFSHDCCATVGTDIVARQSKADAQTSFDIIASLEVAVCGPEYRRGSISGNNKIRQGQRFYFEEEPGRRSKSK
jgi:hypothetical protein